MDIVPDTGQLSQVMVQATAPAFILGAVAGFISILLGRMTSVIDRIRSLNEIADGDTARAHLKSDIPRLRRRAKLLNSATHLALASGMCTNRSGCSPRGSGTRGFASFQAHLCLRRLSHLTPPLSCRSGRRL